MASFKATFIMATWFVSNAMVNVASVSSNPAPAVTFESPAESLRLVEGSALPVKFDDECFLLSLIHIGRRGERFKPSGE